MGNYKYSIVIRCSDDFRLFNLLSQINTKEYQVLIGLTPNSLIEQKLETLGIKYVLSKKGNTAITTNKVLPYVVCDNVLLLDSDCLLFPDTLNRFYELIKLNRPDFIRPNIDFEVNNFSSYLTKVQRCFQYNAFDFVYEPCLLVNLKSALPKIGGYLFSDFAPFTPDGELDYRIKNSKSKFLILKDQKKSIKHLALDFRRNLKSHWRYGKSEAITLQNTGVNMMSSFFSRLHERYSKTFSLRYSILTLPAVLICDIVYVFSFYRHKNQKI